MLMDIEQDREFIITKTDINILETGRIIKKKVKEYLNSKKKGNIKEVF